MVDEILTLQPERPAHGGAAVAKAPDGRTVFVRGAIPGETVRARVTADHKTFLWADTIEVIEPSEYRVEHVWPDPKEVGASAADLGHVAPTYQLEWKAKVLQDQLRRIGGPEVFEAMRELLGEGFVLKTTPSEPNAATRTRIQLVADENGKLGMRPYRSDRVVPLDHVPIAVPEIAEVGKLDPTLPGSPWAGKWESGDRISIESPSDSDPVLATKNASYNLETAEETENPSVWTVNANGQTAKFEVRPGGFWQTHQDAPSVLAGAVLRAAKVDRGSTVIELYSGAGLFSKFLAEQVGPSGTLLTLEADADAVNDAGANLADEIEDDFAAVFQGNVDKTSIGELVSEAKGHVDTIVLDPPRKGAGRRIVEAIAATDVTRVVLVSCDPAAAARDIKDFMTCGFMPESIEAWDLFPNTHHFETVVGLTR